ncbi:hypothetical protein D3C71_1141300 [compost metagenome]
MLQQLSTENLESLDCDLSLLSDKDIKMLNRKSQWVRQGMVRYSIPKDMTIHEAFFSKRLGFVSFSDTYKICKGIRRLTLVECLIFEQLQRENPSMYNFSIWKN